jgi:integrase
MGSVRVRKETGLLFLDFRYDGQRRREQTALPDTFENRKRLVKVLQRIEQQIKDGSFDYGTAFPSSNAKDKPGPAAQFATGRAAQATSATAIVGDTPLFRTFTEQWIAEHSVEWRRSHLRTLRSTVDGHLLPRFGEVAVGAIRREDVLAFRSQLAALPGRQDGSTLSPKRINSVIAILRQILNEAAERYGFPSPITTLKPLKVRRTDVRPFSLAEVQLMLSTVRADYRDYLTVRCFTGMRSGEVDGLQWKYVDFERRLILIRETRVLGEDEYTKTDGSQREIQMSGVVYDALRRQEAASRKLSKYVFCNRVGNPIDNKNFVDRVWEPLLRHLGLELRRPYQMRHTAATLWLAAGENPEWIARQLGHANTEMLFKVYSRYVPNLTRQDGSAMERLLASSLAAPTAAGATP